MDKLNPITDNGGFRSDVRDMRKSLEKGLVENKPTRIQLNDLILWALVFIAAIVSFADATISFGSVAKITVLVVFLYIVTTLVYRNRYSKGKERGKLDAEYIEAVNDYKKQRQSVYDRAVASKMPEFCKFYKTKELREYRESLLSDVDMEYEEYKEKYMRMNEPAIMRSNLPIDVKHTLIKCNRAKPLHIVPSVIMTDAGESDRQKLIGQSGREREKHDKRSQIISRAVLSFLSGAIAINVMFDFSIFTVLQWFFRMFPVVFAMITGEDDGYCCVTVTETKFKKDQCAIINLFNEWVRDTETKKIQ